jgi:hypothetical protein
MACCSSAICAWRLATLVCVSASPYCRNVTTRAMPEKTSDARATVDAMAFCWPLISWMRLRIFVCSCARSNLPRYRQVRGGHELELAPSDPQRGEEGEEGENDLGLADGSLAGDQVSERLLVHRARFYIRINPTPLEDTKTDVPAVDQYSPSTWCRPNRVLDLGSISIPR